MIPWERTDPDFGITPEELGENSMAEETKPKGTIGPVTTSSAAGTGIAGAAGVLIVWIVSLFGLEIPAEVAGAIVVLLGAIGTLVGGKVVPPERAGKRTSD